MTPEQIQAVKCAYADLVGVYQSAYDSDSLAYIGHDWDSHIQTIRDLEKAFSFLEPINDDRFTDYSEEYGEAVQYQAEHGDYPCIGCTDANVDDGRCVNETVCKAWQTYKNWEA